MASDRLRKAIERNRAKQARRAGANSQADFFGQSSNASSSNLSSSKPPRQTEPASSWRPPGAKSTVSSSRASSLRKSVATADQDVEFSTDIKSRRRPVSASKASYLPVTTKRKQSVKRKTKRAKGSDQDLIRYLVIAGWLFCGVLVLRLIFSGGGVWDFYQSRALLDSRFIEHQRIESENSALEEEIRLIQESASYQRQLVRDHLGFIASDEFLVIFPSSRSESQGQENSYSLSNR